MSTFTKIAIFAIALLITIPAAGTVNGRDNQIALGHNHTCSLIGGKLQCWGSNHFGQSDIPNTVTRPSQVVAADQNTCVMDEHNVTCWGIDGLDVFPINNGHQLSTGGFHVCVIDDDGLWCYRGGNFFGELEVPMDLANPQQVAAGYTHSCVLDDNGVHCWGSNDHGEIDVPPLNQPISISAGAYYSCAIDRDGVTCWGLNDFGQTDVPSLINPVAVNAGLQHACAIDEAGVRCWGKNQFLQADTPSIQDPSSVVAGTHHSCSVSSVNAVQCWGYNGEGQTNVPNSLAAPRPEQNVSIRPGRTFPLARSPEIQQHVAPVSAFDRAQNRVVTHPSVINRIPTVEHDDAYMMWETYDPAGNILGQYSLSQLVGKGMR
ncbi:MAG: hypothetical protein AAF525_10625 [Pseudomonadota bacterium]